MIPKKSWFHRVMWDPGIREDGREKAIHVMTCSSLGSPDWKQLDGLFWPEIL